MKEVEVLVTFDDNKEQVLNKLSKFKFIEKKQIYDIYYIDELRKNLHPEPNLRMNEIFRVRRKGKECLVTYKINRFKDHRWIYSDEYETKVEDYKTYKKIIEMLGLRKLITVHNKRMFYHFGNYEIIFEEVKDLGLFIEVERMVPNNI